MDDGGNHTVEACHEGMDGASVQLDDVGGACVGAFVERPQPLRSVNVGGKAAIQHRDANPSWEAGLADDRNVGS